MDFGGWVNWREVWDVVVVFDGRRHVGVNVTSDIVEGDFCEDWRNWDSRDGLKDTRVAKDMGGVKNKRMTYREQPENERIGVDVVVFGVDRLESTTSTDEEVQCEHVG